MAGSSSAGRWSRWRRTTSRAVCTLCCPCQQRWRQALVHQRQAAAQGLRSRWLPWMRVISTRQASKGSSCTVWGAGMPWSVTEAVTAPHRHPSFRQRPVRPGLRIGLRIGCASACGRTASEATVSFS
jgi:hypothetical protein